MENKIEILEKEIRSLKKQRDDIVSRNSYSGEVSFLTYQICEDEKQIRAIKNGLTYKQQTYLDSIVAFIEINGYTPSYRELATRLKVKSPATINKILTKLEEKGLIKFNEQRSRFNLVNEPTIRDLKNKLYEISKILKNDIVVNDLDYYYNDAQKILDIIEGGK